METYIATQRAIKSHIYVHCFYHPEKPAGGTPADLAHDGTWLPPVHSVLLPDSSLFFEH